MKISAEFVRFEYSNAEDERWIALVRGESALGVTEFRVYADTANLEVEPSGTAKRARFAWDDWAFENTGGSVESASVLAVLCVLAQDVVEGLSNAEAAEPDRDRVATEHACPKCREARVDHLVMLDERVPGQEQRVRCSSCGHVYAPR